MARYVNGAPTNIIIDGVSYRVRVRISSSLVEGTVLLSSDGYVLTDTDGAYITVREDN